MFEVDDIGDDGVDDCCTIIFKTALARVLDELGPKQKHFQNALVKISSEQLRKVEKIKPFGHSRVKIKIKICHFLPFSPAWGN